MSFLSANKLVDPRTPGGFPELLPGQQIAFNRMLAQIRQTYETFGFTPIETPAFELDEVLLAKGGGETEKQRYSVGRAMQSGQLDPTGMSLHFDLTVPLARYAAEHVNELVFPFKRYQMQKVWRAEKRQSGRYNEFYQCDVDVIGSSDPMYDAEMPAVIWSAFEAMGLPDINIRMSNRKLLNGILESVGVTADSEPSQADVLRMIDKIDKTGKTTIFAQLEDMGLSTSTLELMDMFLEFSGTNSDILNALSGMTINETFEEGFNELSQVFECIELFGVPEGVCTIDLSTARGLDYYTGTVYETTLKSIPDVGSVCSGGRFDNLVGCYTETSLPGVGISIGATRLFMKLLDAGLIEDVKQSVPSYVLVANRGGKCLERAIEIATAIRKQGTPAEAYLQSVSLAKQYRYADRNGIPNVVVVGEQELEDERYPVKDLATGKEDLMDLTSIVKMFGAE